MASLRIYLHSLYVMESRSIDQWNLVMIYSLAVYWSIQRPILVTHRMLHSRNEYIYRNVHPATVVLQPTVPLIHVLQTFLNSWLALNWSKISPYFTCQSVTTPPPAEPVLSTRVYPSDRTCWLVWAGTQEQWCVRFQVLTAAGMRIQLSGIQRRLGSLK